MWPANIFSLDGRRPKNVADQCCGTLEREKWRLFVSWVQLLYRVSQEEWTKLRESVPYVKLYRYPKLNGYGDNGQRSLKL